MHDLLRERLWRTLESLPEERLYQVLDYVEFLGSKYAREGMKPAPSGLRRFGERLEDRLRSNGVGLRAIRSTLEVVGGADRVVADLADAGRSLLREVEQGWRAPAPRPGSAGERAPALEPGAPQQRDPAG